MHLFVSYMKSAIEIINLQRFLNLPLTQRGTFLTLMQLHFNYFTIIAAVVKKKYARFCSRILILFSATFDNTIHDLLPCFP